MYLIDHIDKIARDKQRDVLMITFHKDWLDFNDQWRSDNNHPRNIIIGWLNENNIEWKECGCFTDESGWESYRGQIYVDAPYDTKDPTFQKLSNFLEDENGQTRPEFGTTKFCYVLLSDAMKNAHHDEPGFWERWAETL